MAEATDTTVTKKDLKTVVLSVLTAVLGAMVLGLGGFILFGLEKWVEDIASNQVKTGGVPQTTITEIQNRLTGIETTLSTQAERDQEFREQMHADMRNLTQLMMTRRDDSG